MNQNELEKKSADDFLEATMTNDDKKSPARTFLPYREPRSRPAGSKRSRA